MSMRNLLLAMSTGVLLCSCTQAPKLPTSLSVTLMKNQEAEVVKYTSDLNVKPLSTVQEIKRIAVISDVSHDMDQAMWEMVRRNWPDLVLVSGNSGRLTKVGQKVLSEQYRKLDENPDYRQLRESTPFMAAWDELDYGLVNGDGDYPLKRNAKKNFIGYWNYIPDLQSSSNEGIEHSYIFGSKKRVQVIVLDTRYYSSPWVLDGEERLQKNWSEEATLLGETQWRWLGQELRKPADYRIIVSPLPIGAIAGQGERWGLLPKERQRFFDLLRETKAQNYLVISGGTGFGSLSKVELIEYSPLYNLTVGPFNGESKKASSDRRYVRNPISGNNFGLIEWDDSRGRMIFKIVGADGKTIQSHRVTLNE